MLILATFDCELKQLESLLLRYLHKKTINEKGISFSALIFICISFSAFSTANAPLKIALLKYGGGGDWYANPTSLTNLIRFVNKEMNMGVDQSYATVEVGSADIFNFPFVHMTGHGNVVFQNLKHRISGCIFSQVDFYISTIIMGWIHLYDQV